MWLILIFGLSVQKAYGFHDGGVIYDKYTGRPVSDDALRTFERTGVTSVCTMKIMPCDPNEGRRIDGACNSLKHPSMGTFQVPQLRILKAHFHDGYYPRKADSGADLELPRVIRNTLLSEGKVSSSEFTQLMPAYGNWFFGDLGSIHDILYFLNNKTDCCHPDHMNDFMCTPNIYPEDDPVHRFSGIRCTNLTRPLDHQYLGCTDDPVPSPISPTTAVIDMSQLYNAANGGDKAVRSYEGGKLEVDVDDKGIVWPPKGEGLCMGNKASEGETRCYTNYGTALMHIMFISLWQMRSHNLFATRLAEINPCWDDDRLFYEAREINIATYQQVVYYEWLPAVIGTRNLVSRGVISSSRGHRDVYDDEKFPLATLEFVYAMRWFHVAQDGSAYKYHPNGTYLGKVSSTELMFRPGFLDKEDNYIGLGCGLFYQNSAEIDNCVDPEFAENGMGSKLQASVDITTSDLHKARTLGLAPYIDYVQHFTGHEITTWEDLEEHMTMERIKQLKLVYAHPRDIDLLAGMWSEKMIKGGKIPAILAYIIMDYAKTAVVSDRHWYERPNRPHPFTAGQLREIRKYTLAQLICDNADGVSKIQRHAIFASSPKNPVVDCSEIDSIDLTAWADPSCRNDDWPFKRMRIPAPKEMMYRRENPYYHHPL